MAANSTVAVWVLNLDSTIMAREQATGNGDEVLEESGGTDEAR